LDITANCIFAAEEVGKHSPHPITSFITNMALKKLDHEFKNSQLSYDAEPNYQPLIKLSFFFNKLPHVSYDQFHRHWETVHADLTIAAKDFKVCKIQRYVQFHQTPEMKEKAKMLGLEHVAFDGCSEVNSLRGKLVARQKY
jgi:hypothetical protein